MTVVVKNSSVFIIAQNTAGEDVILDSRLLNKRDLEQYREKGVRTSFRDVSGSTFDGANTIIKAVGSWDSTSTERLKDTVESLSRDYEEANQILKEKECELFSRPPKENTLKRTHVLRCLKSVCNF